ncbi:ScbA/BarX family gamma-butyrolactone biosynthesis protein [Amorphoplanes digitatis]|uniref:A-factor biosynthesis hotdog domain-containing protein n=1 Tax=Actinoplanes digitatis TaxID=1868 RepID=A0A7W7MRN8_9ACTN|nr:ScbA/BarX family gamma-butyrolactone biosynthesis protein [Actinoplanes digitatis]MBB4764453.1 hypothetical protein [Actinoplanes digitatis]
MPRAGYPFLTGPRPLWRTDVRPEFVHRHGPADIFPVRWRRSSENRFEVVARWPATHRFFAVAAGQDPLLVMETMRQTAMLLAHAEFSVPLGDRFVMRDLTWSCAREFATGASHGDILMDVRCTDVRRGRGALRGMRVAVRYRRGDTLLATSEGTVNCISTAAYHRVRGDRAAVATPVPPPGVPPVWVGRTVRDDVVLAAGPGPGRWLLRVDTRHPTLFGRPNDHAPGILLLEAARQAANAADPLHAFVPAAARVEFHRYAELDRPCVVEIAGAEPGDGPATVRVEGHQDGHPIFSAVLTRRGR